MLNYIETAKTLNVLRKFIESFLHVPHFLQVSGLLFQWFNSPSSKFQLLFNRLIIFFILLDPWILHQTVGLVFFTDIDLLVHLISRVISPFIS